MAPESDRPSLSDPAEAEYFARLSRVLGGDFELQNLIGRGGFGVVYRALDRRLDRPVAVKALRHDLFPTPELLQRFNREARAVAKLRHPNILPVYAVGEGEGIAYMVMPFVEGESLESYLKREGKLSTADAVRITSESAEALEAAHNHGLVHRDVKPANIMLEGDGRRALLMDFGIAKPLASDDAALTGTGMILGSPAYMSPEQARGEREIDGRSDIYSLGAVAYEMLSGRRPIVAANMHELVYKQVTQKIADLAEAAPGQPAHVTHAVMRSLAPDPAQRWQTAADFARMLSTSESSAVGEDRDGDLTEESWLSRRGPQLALLIFVAYSLELWLFLTGDDAASRDAGEVAILRLIRIGLAVLGLVALGEGAQQAVVRRRRGQPSRRILRSLFGQPNWWQAWYPAALRTADTVWSRLPFSMKLLRTLLWMEAIILPAGQVLAIFVIPTFEHAAHDVAGQSPVLLRAFVGLVWTLTFIAPVALGLFLWYGWRYRKQHGVSWTAFIASLITLRGSHWQGSPARVILRDR